MQQLVVRFLREEGFLLAADQLKKKGQTACRIAVVAANDADAEAGQATLSLDFADLPPPATLREVAVKGTERVTAASLRSFLKLKEGGRVSEADRRVWEEQLRLSGRFIRHKVALEPGASRDGGVTAVFDLLAYPKVTPLGEPLTREEAVMLRFRSWLSEAAGKQWHPGELDKARWHADGVAAALCGAWSGGHAGGGRWRRGCGGHRGGLGCFSFAACRPV